MYQATISQLASEAIVKGLTNRLMKAQVNVRASERHTKSGAVVDVRQHTMTVDKAAMTTALAKLYSQGHAATFTSRRQAAAYTAKNPGLAAFEHEGEYHVVNRHGAKAMKQLGVAKADLTNKTRTGDVDTSSPDHLLASGNATLNTLRNLKPGTPEHKHVLEQYQAIQRMVTAWNASRGKTATPSDPVNGPRTRREQFARERGKEDDDLTTDGIKVKSKPPAAPAFVKGGAEKLKTPRQFELASRLATTREDAIALGHYFNHHVGANGHVGAKWDAAWSEVKGAIAALPSKAQVAKKQKLAKLHEQSSQAMAMADQHLKAAQAKVDSADAQHARAKRKAADAKPIHPAATPTERIAGANRKRAASKAEQARRDLAEATKAHAAMAEAHAAVQAAHEGGGDVMPPMAPPVAAPVAAPKPTKATKATPAAPKATKATPPKAADALPQAKHQLGADERAAYVNGDSFTRNRMVREHAIRETYGNDKPAVEREAYSQEQHDAEEADPRDRAANAGARARFEEAQGIKIPKDKQLDSDRELTKRDRKEGLMARGIDPSVPRSHQREGQLWQDGYRIGTGTDPADKTVMPLEAPKDYEPPHPDSVPDRLPKRVPPGSKEAEFHHQASVKPIVKPSDVAAGVPKPTATAGKRGKKAGATAPPATGQPPAAPEAGAPPTGGKPSAPTGQPMAAPEAGVPAAGDKPPTPGKPPAPKPEPKKKKGHGRVGRAIHNVARHIKDTLQQVMAEKDRENTHQT